MLAILGWVLLALFLLILSIFEADAVMWLTLTIVGGYYVYDNGFWTTLHWLAEHWGQIALGVGIYLFAGSLWMLFKWDRFCAQQAAWNRLKPEWDRYKSRLGGWIIWWPFSMGAYAISDLLTELANWIMSCFGTLLDRISARHFPENADAE